MMIMMMMKKVEYIYDELWTSVVPYIKKEVKMLIVL
jgi:hypothetical protein